MMTGTVQKSMFSGAFSPRVCLLAVLPALLCCAFVWPFSGWKTMSMMSGSTTPGAQGTVKFKFGDNGNTELVIKAQSLAQPSSLTPPENHYVVWIQPPGQDAKDLGAFKVGGKEQGELKAVTPAKRFKIFITAEQNVDESAPMGPTVLSANVTQGS